MNARKHLCRQLGVQRLEDRTVPALLLNELYVNPPGADDNREFVEIRSTTGGVTSMNGVAFVEINGDPGTAGVIDHDIHLSGLTTGSNGLLLLGQNYTTTTPWGTLPAGTALGDRTGTMADNNLTVLLVTGYTGQPGQDLDTNNDGVLDATPWTAVLDSVGWFDPSVSGGRVYSTAVLHQPLLTPDAASRFANNNTPTSAAAWYNGEMLAQGGVPDLTRTYDPSISSANMPANGHITPGDANMLSVVPPRITSTLVNDGAVQRSRVTSLTVSFSTQVTFPGPVASAFSLTRAGGGVVNFSATSNVQGGVTVVTLDAFTGAETNFGSLADGRYTLTALANQITANSLQLDGNGDGLSGDNYTFGDAQGLFRFFGDVNGDQTVNGLDFGFFKNAFGTQLGDASYLSYLDVDGDGVINGFDFGQFRTRFGTALP
jgi:dockerin type I repeat protein